MRRLIVKGDEEDPEGAPPLVRWAQPLGRRECPFAYRWSLRLGRLGSIRVHKWLRPDDDRAHHDHQQDFVTLVLRGGYDDVSTVPLEWSGALIRRWETRVDRLSRGSVRFRRAEHTHTVQNLDAPCWTLLWFAPARRGWGYWVPRRSDGRLKFTKENKYYLTYGHSQCED